MRRRTYKYAPFEILRVIRQSLPRCFYDRGGYANADTFFVCGFVVGIPVGFGSVCFSLAVGLLYVATILWGLCAQCPKSVFLGQNGKNYENRPILAMKF